MKTLYVLRHAKSSWDDPDLADFDRPLNARGETAASFMGGLMARSSFVPDTIIASPAVRAKTTAAMVKAAAGFETKIEHEERIYEASPQALRQVAAAIDDRFGSAMLVGHNPGMEGFIRFLTGRLESMPTAALAVIDLDIENWDQIDAERGRLRQLFRPKEEMKTFGKGT